ncbi:outer membrane lipoprotein-sorting protein [Psychromonas sp. psych-6C06]|uniref:outer membrane lipoprotein-sorting protein n=1 Tax=Psychromonas sp. psych-6C06 TaxID=2058089 RepID=UPI000C33C593|nr:outer membrane lipoprotein-sorting protein [Psychromonas sp. psych-6C06]PKF62784.1 outer membrane lipoprotein-sorting protein [Psychromonas sp. psych-6C06]
MNLFNKLKLTHGLAFTLALSFIIPLTAQATQDEAQIRGLEIAKSRKNIDAGWRDSQSSLEMILSNKQGETSQRELRMKNLEIDNDGDKSISIFDSPKDIRGAAFLTFAHVKGADDQWLYLPALKRVKRISSRNKSGPFMGSEFAYEDLSSFEVEKYTYRYLGEEEIEGQATYMLESVPTDKYSGYSKLITWLHKSDYRVLKSQYYDRKGSLLKTLTASDYKQYLNKHWRAHKMVMDNHQTGKSTELKWLSYQFLTGLEESDFNKNKLKRAR